MAPRSVVAILERAGVTVTRSPGRQLAIDLRQYGSPDVVIDVGVAQGTPELYGAAPDAFLYLVEPLDMFERKIRKILRSRSGEWVRCAVGSVEGEADFKICRDARKSGRQPRPTSDEMQSRVTMVEVRTLDSIFGDDPRVLRSGCLVLKVDCEGDEMEALLGAVGLLDRASVVIIELEFLAGARSYLPSALVELLASRGLELADIVLVGRRDGVAQHADAVFARPDGSRAT